MKKQTVIRSITLSFGLLFVLAAANPAFSQYMGDVSLNNIIVPSGGSMFSGTFYATHRGEFSVTVRLRTNTLLGYGGKSGYRVELMRDKSTTVLAWAEKTVGSYFESVSVKYNVANCNLIGGYRLRVRNTSTDNPQQGQATFPTFQVPRTYFLSVGLAVFNLSKDSTTERQIPGNKQPSGQPSLAETFIIAITAKWFGNCAPDPRGCKLTFKLKRNGTIMASSTGYANSYPKMKVSSQSNQKSGTWSFEVTGSSIADVSNIDPSIRLESVCQN